MIAFHCERLLFSAVHVYYRFDIRWKYGNEKTRRTCIIIIKRTGGGGQQYKKRRDIHAMCPILLYSVSDAVNQSEKNCDSIYYALDLFFFTTYFKDLLSSLSTWPLQAGIFFYICSRVKSSSSSFLLCENFNSLSSFNLNKVRAFFTYIAAL